MRSSVLLGAGVLAVTASVGVAVVGVATTQVSLPGGRTVDLPVLGAPPAAASGLSPFEGCEQLRQWYVEQALREVGPYGFEGGWVWGGIPDVRRDVALPAGGAEDLAGTTPRDAAASSDTGTNVQEAGVDEPDRAKTADDLVVHVAGRRLVVTDVSGAAPRRAGSLALPHRLHQTELLLDGDRVLVLGQEGWGGGWYGPAATDLVTRPAGPLVADTRLLEVSLADPADPVVVSDRTYEGTLLSARQHGGSGGTVRLVLSTGYPTLDFVQPGRSRSLREAEAENRRIVRESLVEDWLPAVRSEGGREPLLDCEDVHHPRVGSGVGTLTVVTLPGGDPAAPATTAVTAGGDTVYSSTDRLYLATSPWDRRGRTDLHAFALDGTSTMYVASGVVEGTVRDRWSLDEHDGHLRVAVAHGLGLSPRENGITVLREDGPRLEVVGSVRGLGPREEIKSVRWFDDLALVVTFRQTDPLYTVDLSDPARPRTLGELKIPGFSEYLHPIGDDRLLGVGVDATKQGVERGGQVSSFDVTDLGDPRRDDVLDLGAAARPVTGWEPRAFTWLPDRAAALVAVQEGWRGRVSLRTVEVDGDGSLGAGAQWELPSYDATAVRALPLADGRVALVTDDVRLIEP